MESQQETETSPWVPHALGRPHSSHQLCCCFLHLLQMLKLFPPHSSCQVKTWTNNQPDLQSLCSWSTQSVAVLAAMGRETRNRGWKERLGCQSHIEQRLRQVSVICGLATASKNSMCNTSTRPTRCGMQTDERLVSSQTSLGTLRSHLSSLKPVKERPKSHTNNLFWDYYLPSHSLWEESLVDAVPSRTDWI